MEVIGTCPTCGGKPRLVKASGTVMAGPHTLESIGEVTILAENLDPLESMVRCQKCSAEYPLEFLESYTYSILTQLRGALLERNMGRELDCWPLGSFGWKDADLEPEGCTGIRSFSGYEGAELLITVGGHKSFSAPVNWDCADEEEGLSDEEFDSLDAEWRDTIFEVCCLETCWNMDWDCDEVTVYFEDIVRVEVPFERNYDVLAEEIIAEAKKATTAFSESMKGLSEQIDEMENHVNRH